jgi:hypothetical protein
MLQARPHAIHFKRILDFGEGQVFGFANGFSCATADPTVAAAKTKKPTTKHSLRSMSNTPVSRTKYIPQHRANEKPALAYKP